MEKAARDAALACICALAAFRRLGHGRAHPSREAEQHGVRIVRGDVPTRCEDQMDPGFTDRRIFFTDMASTFFDAVVMEYTREYR